MRRKFFDQSHIDCEQEDEHGDDDCYIDKIQSLLNFCVADGWKVHELKSIMKNLNLPSEKTDDLLVTATAAISLVERMEADIMDFEEPNAPTEAATTSSEAATTSSTMEVETVEEEVSPSTIVLEAATTSEAATTETATAPPTAPHITPPPQPMLTRYTKIRDGDLIMYREDTFKYKKDGVTLRNTNNNGGLLGLHNRDLLLN